MTSGELVLRVEWERETKNTIRYHEVTGDEQEASVGTLYVNKAAVAELGDPATLLVAIRTTGGTD